MSIRTFNGQWLIAGAGVATADDCCCDSQQGCKTDADCGSLYCCYGVCQAEPCVCVCPTECPAGWGGSVDGNAMTCDPSSGRLEVFFTSGSFDVYGWCECNDPFAWNCGVTVLGPFCSSLYGKTVPVESDCFPAAGSVAWAFGPGGGATCSYPTPDLVLTKNPFP